jgi:hypothetical protein
VEVFCATREPARAHGRWSSTGRALSLDELLAARDRDQVAAPAV